MSDLTAGYRAREVVRGITATCPAGVLTAILGPNGSGKTTLLRALAGYLPLRRGELWLGPADLRRLNVRERARLIALVPQVSPDNVPVTVAEAVAISRYPWIGQVPAGQQDHSAVVESALAALELTGLRDQPCSQLSGGEWRRVLLAQGLAQETPVLLLDEPTAFLDPPARAQTLHLISQLTQEHGLTAVVTLHDLDLALRYASHVLLLKAGELLAAGTAKETLTVDFLTQLYDCAPEWLAVREDMR